MNAKLILVGLAGMIALAFLASRMARTWSTVPYAAACWGYGYSTYYSTGVPYFALHPPVYYSYRVARTYGYSPFAYPPGVLTPGSEPPRAAVVQNVYPAPTGVKRRSRSRAGSR